MWYLLITVSVYFPATELFGSTKITFQKIWNSNSCLLFPDLVFCAFFVTTTSFCCRCFSFILVFCILLYFFILFFQFLLLLLLLFYFAFLCFFLSCQFWCCCFYFKYKISGESKILIPANYPEKLNYTSWLIKTLSWIINYYIITS